MIRFSPTRQQSQPGSGRNRSTCGLEWPRAQRERSRSGTTLNAAGLDTPGRRNEIDNDDHRHRLALEGGTGGVAATRRVRP